MEFVNFLNQNQGAALVALTFVYVIATIALVNLGRRNINTIIRLEENRVRPFVIFNIATRMPTRRVVASIKNVGLSVAHNVRVTTLPQLLHVGTNTPSALTSQTIFFLSPHAEEIDDLIGQTWDYYEEHKQTVFAVSVEYEDSNGKKFSEQYQIDLTYLKQRRHAADPSIIEELQKLNETLVAISKHIETDESGMTD